MPVGDYFITPTGDDLDDGSAGAPWATFANAARLQAGSTLTITTGTYAAGLVLRNGVVAAADGGTVTIDGRQSIKGSAGDWTEISTNRWQRSWSSSGRVILIRNGVETPATWRRANTTDVTASGRWHADTSAITVYATSNPASFFTTLEVNGVGAAVTTGDDCELQGTFAAYGWECFYRVGANPSWDRLIGRYAAGPGIDWIGGGTVTTTTAGVDLRHMGWETITGNDVDGHGIRKINAAAVYSGEINNPVIHNTRCDALHFEGDASSLIVVRGTAQDLARLTKCGFDENIADTQGGNYKFIQVFGSAAPDADGNQPGRVHNSLGRTAGAITSEDCLWNQHGTAVLAHIRSPNGAWNNLRTGNYCPNANMVTFEFTGQTSTQAFSHFYVSASSVSPYSMLSGSHRLIHSTFVGNTNCVSTARSSRASSGFTIARESGPDGDGNYTYSVTTTLALGVGSGIEIADASVSTTMNGFYTFESVEWPSTTTYKGYFKVPSAQNPPDTGSIVYTGMVLRGFPKLLQLDGNALGCTGDVLTLARIEHAPSASYGANYIHDTNNANDRPVRIDSASGILRYTAAQTVSETASAGNLKFDTGGKFGGSVWKAQTVTATFHLIISGATAVIAGGLVIYTKTAHGLVTGMSGLFEGQTPVETNGGHWITKIDDNSFSTVAEIDLADQTVTGTITIKTGVPRSGWSGENLSPTYDVSAITTTDFQHLSLPGSGRDFGCNAAAA